MNSDAPLLEVPERIGHGRPLLERDQHARAPALDAALVRRVAVEDPVHHAGAAGVGQELAVIADQGARGCLEDQALLAGAGRPHLDQLGPPLAELVDHRPGEGLVDVDHHLLDRLQRLAGLRVVCAAARAAGRSTARSPRGAWSRSARRAAVRRGLRPRSRRPPAPGRPGSRRCPLPRAAGAPRSGAR